MSFLPDDLGPMARFDERVLQQFNDSKAKKKMQDNEDKNTERNLRMTHGKKVGKDWKKFKSELDKKKTSSARRDPKKGVKAVSGGKWGYVKNGKFTPD
ncbi:MAG: hypothetical protein CMA59_00395 [Euryarchaeota archaeon]|jgi:hypothetical protein|nr:hypothetical protein [Euryarchaeota archaeon]|tara:strand:- start:189 stop:482 length:294 start_codon:yes stop_codon:yes gene_type:complete